MKSKEEILKPFIETPFRHCQVVEKDNALIAMEQYGNEIADSLGRGWISMNDEKPKDYQRVIWFDSRDNTIHVDYFVLSQTPVPYATHWQHLPVSPTKK